MIPDLGLHVSPVQKGSGFLLAVVECAFSQSHKDLLEKMKSEVDGWPKIVLVILILVSEHCNYHSPSEGMLTWEFFSQHNIVDVCLTIDGFLTLPQSAERGVLNINKSNSSELSESSTMEQPNSPDPAEAGTNSKSEYVAEPVVLDPMIVAGHIWCNIKKVEYHVWVKGWGQECKPG